MSDDLRDWDAVPLLGDIVAALEVELDRGRQYYTIPVGQQWLVFYNGKAYIN